MFVRLHGSNRESDEETGGGAEQQSFDGAGAMTQKFNGFDVARSDLNDFGDVVCPAALEGTVRKDNESPSMRIARARY